MPPTPEQPANQGQPGVPPPGGERPGELLDRFLARLIDGILIAIVNAVLVSVVVVGALMGSDGGFYYSTGGSYAASLVGTVLGVVINLGYFAFMESSRGQTVGKMVMKLHVRGPQGGNPTMEQAIRRNIFLAFSLAGIVPIIGGLVGGLAALVAVIMIAVGINNDPARRQAWHDKFAGGTYVVKTG